MASMSSSEGRRKRRFRAAGVLCLLASTLGNSCSVDKHHGASLAGASGSAGIASATGGARDPSNGGNAGMNSGAGSLGQAGSSLVGGASSGGTSNDSGGSDTATAGAPDGGLAGGGSGSVADCEQNERRCRTGVNNTPEVCSARGQWMPEPICSGDAPYCVDGFCRTCEPGERRCELGVPQLCSASFTWENQTPCSGATPACVEKTGTCGTCTPGDVQCGNAATPELCGSDGTWKAQAACTGSTPACLAGKCVACNPNAALARQCVGDTPQVCNSTGSWVSQAACSGDTPRCLPASGTCVCKENALHCRDGNTPEKCNATGQWVAQSDCSGDTPVCSGGTCTCVEGKKECSTTTTARTCAGGAWQTEYCLGTNVPVCYDGSCVQCTPGTIECDSDRKTLKTCSAQGTWSVQQCPAMCNGKKCYDPRDEPGLGCDWTYNKFCATGCCAYSGTIGPDGISCDATGTQCTFPCDSASDCASGNVCCYYEDPGLPRTRCVSATECVTMPSSPYTSYRWQVCNPANPVCPSGKTCSSTTVAGSMELHICE